MPYGDDWGTDRAGYEDIGFHIQASEWVPPEGNWRDYTWRASGEVTDPDTGDVLNESYTLIINLGDNWISDDGETVVNTRKETARFPNNSKMGRIVEALVKLDDAGEIDLNKVGNPKLASSYVGLKLRMERYEYSYPAFKNRVTGDMVEAGISDVLLPVQVLPGSKGAVATGPVTSQTSGTKTPSKAGKPSAAEAAANGGLESDLIAFAKDFTDKDEFTAAALGDPELATDAHFDRADEVLADRALVRRLMKGEIWEQAQA